jgi:hypothetical protein
MFRHHKIYYHFLIFIVNRYGLSADFGTDRGVTNIKQINRIINDYTAANRPINKAFKV